LFDEYIDLTLTEEYRAAGPKTNSNFTPKSGLDDLDLDEFLKDLPKCGNNARSCKNRIVTDADCRAFLKLSPKKKVPDDHEKELEDLFMIIDEPEPQIPKRKHPATTNNSQQSANGNPHIFKKAAMSRTNEVSQNSFPTPPPKIAAKPQPSNYNNLFTKPSQVPTFAPPKTIPERSIIAKPAQELRQVEPSPYSDFKSSHEFRIQNLKKTGDPNQNAMQRSNVPSTSGSRKLLGGKYVNSSYKQPITKAEEPQKMEMEVDEDPLVAQIEPHLLERIKQEVVVNTTSVTWNDIAGLEEAKKTIQEAVVIPLLRPDLFTGNRSAPKGILLFGPPGTGKTLIGKCIASQSKSTFFSISASSLGSKWIGEAEKLVRALFVYARAKQPSVIFIDEIDSLLKKRSENEHETNRRVKTEFFIQLEGATTAENDQVLVVAATNRPQELDDAARRRFTKRLYIPLPDRNARARLIENLIQKNLNSLTDVQINEIAKHTDEFSGADIKTLVSEAAFMPMRDLTMSQIEVVDVSEVS
jgi:fidgetin-like protein 1